MKIEDKRNDNKRKCAGVGDMVVTNKNNKYLQERAKSPLLQVWDG